MLFNSQVFDLDWTALAPARLISVSEFFDGFYCTISVGKECTFVDVSAYTLGHLQDCVLCKSVQLTAVILSKSNFISTLICQLYNYGKP